MKLFRISQDQRNDYGTYDSAVVCAEDETTARSIRPDGSRMPEKSWNGSWCSRVEDVCVEYLGEARDGMPEGVVCASFNAG